MTFRRLNRAHVSPRAAVELARSQKLARLFYRGLDAPQVADRGRIRQAIKNLRHAHFSGVGSRSGRSSKSLDRKVSRGQSLLELAFDRRHFQNLVKVVHIQHFQRTRSIALLPGIVINLVNELAADVLTHFLEQLAKQMGEQCAGSDNALVRISIAVINLELTLHSLDQTAHYPSSQIHLAGLQRCDIGSVATELDVGQVLGLKQAAHITLLVLRSRAVLEVVAQILNGVLAGIHFDVRTLLERGRKHVHQAIICVRAPNQVHDVLVALHSKSAEHHHKRNILAEAGHAHCEGVTKPIKPGTHAHLQLLWRGCK